LAVIVNAVASTSAKKKGNTKSHQTSTRLQRWRITSGLSLEEESDLTGYSTAMLSLAERGLREFSPMAKVQMARRLGVAISDLFEVEPVRKDERPNVAAS
jgi:transcriptional regulator with XRE-family HTH domain